MSHPYRDRDRYNRHEDNVDLDEFINNAVRFGTGVGSSVLNSVAEALNSVSAGQVQAEPDFARYKRQLDSRLSGPHGGWMTMGVFGWIFFGCFGIAAFVMAVLTAVYGASYSPVFPLLAQIFGFVTLGFGVMGYAGCHKANYNGRLRKYLRVMRDYTASVREIAKGSVKPVKRVTADLRKAIADGKLPNGCMDEACETLYLDEALYEKQTPQPAAAAEKPQLDDAERLRRDGLDFLRYLQSCRGKLDASAEDELAAMQKTCGAILGFVHNHPEQLPRVRRFEDYYLPTTRKLLDTALGLGDTEAANAQNIRHDIAGILHTLNIAYSKLYDTLLQDVSMDVSTEIDTLETMLRQDGLTHDFESDFGKKKA